MLLWQVMILLTKMEPKRHSRGDGKGAGSTWNELSLRCRWQASCVDGLSQEEHCGDKMRRGARPRPQGK